jgi:hypothetical protein
MNTVFIIFILILSGLLAGVIFHLVNTIDHAPAQTALHPPVSHPINNTRRYAGRFSSPRK